MLQPRRPLRVDRLPQNYSAFRTATPMTNRPWNSRRRHPVIPASPPAACFQAPPSDGIETSAPTACSAYTSWSAPRNPKLLQTQAGRAIPRIEAQFKYSVA